MSNLTQDQFNSAAREFIQDVVTDHSPYDRVGMEIDEALAYALAEFLERTEADWNDYTTEELAEEFSDEIQTLEIGNEIAQPEIIWNHEIMEFWGEFEGECDETFQDHGCDVNDNHTISGIIADAVHYTLYRFADETLNSVKDDFQTGFSDYMES